MRKTGVTGFAIVIKDSDNIIHQLILTVPQVKQIWETIEGWNGGQVYVSEEAFEPLTPPPMINPN